MAGRSKRAGWIIFGAFVVVIASGLLILNYVNNLDPVIHIPKQKLPKPNGYDYYVCAAESIKNESLIWTMLTSPVGTGTILVSGPCGPPGPLGPVYPMGGPPGPSAAPQAGPGMPAGPGPIRVRRYSITERESLLNDSAEALRQFRKGLALPCVVKRQDRLSGACNPKLARLIDLLELERQVQGLKGSWGAAMRSSLDRVSLELGFGRYDGTATTAYARGIARHLKASEASQAANRLLEIQASLQPLHEELEEDKWRALHALRRDLRSRRWRDRSCDPSLVLFLDPVQCARYAWQDPRYFGWSVRQTRDFMLVNKRRLYTEEVAYWDACIECSHKRYPKCLDDPGHLPSTPYNWTGYQMDVKRYLLKKADLATLAVELALRAHKLDQGTYPERLSQLTPRYISRIPTDPFAPGRALHYRRSGAEFVLYSVGPDAKDDGGQPMAAIYHRAGDLLSTFWQAKDPIAVRTTAPM